MRPALYIALLLLLAACGPAESTGPVPVTLESSTASPTPEPVFFSCVDGEDADLPGHVDILRLDADYADGNLLISFTLRDAPEQLEFNQGHIAGLYQEYAWGIYIDADANPQTGGSRGEELWITARYLADSSQPAFWGETEEHLEVVIFRYDRLSDSYTETQSPSRRSVQVDPSASTLSFSAWVPNLTSEKIIDVEAYSYEGSDSCLVLNTAAPANPAEEEQTATATNVPTEMSTATPMVDIAPSGYDIAAVSIENPEPDIVRVQFYYRLPDGIQAAYISLYVPPACRAERYSFVWQHPNTWVSQPLGWAELEYQHALQGDCESNVALLQIWPIEYEGDTGHIGDVAYDERFEVAWRAARDWPTVNTRTVIFRNFRFESLDGWKGQIAFDYIIDENIPLARQQIYFALRGTSNACSFQNEGGVITEHTGIYTIQFDLQQDMFFDAVCLQGYNSYTFHQYYFYAVEQATDRTAIFHIIDLTTTFRGPVLPTAGPSATRTPAPTVTSTPLPLPSSTLTSRPPTATPIPPLVTGIPGAIFHRLCDAIQAENPRAGCPIVTLPGVLSQNNRFLGFVDEQRRPTGYGIDLDNPQGWCGGNTGTECDLWLVLRYASWCSAPRLGIYCLSRVNEATRQEIDKCYQQGHIDKDYFIFPISRSYLGILDNENISLARNMIHCP